MLNQVVLVGRLTSDIEVKELEEGKKIASITMAIPSSFKNINGEYETDFITCRLWNNIATNTAEYCKKGDIVGVKGKIQSIVNENALGEKEYKTEIIAEKVTFLSSKKESEEK